MQYNSKAYLYYKLLDEKYIEDPDKVNEILEYLGDFEIKPGSLKIGKDKYGAKSIECSDFKPKNTEWGISNLTIDYNIIIKGMYNCRRTKLEIGELFNKTSLALIDLNKGVYYYRSDYFTGKGLEWKPLCVYYDKETLDILVSDFGYTYDDIIELAPEQIIRLGIIPDKAILTNLSELGIEDYKSFISEILNKLPCDELEAKFEKLFEGKEALDENYVKQLKRDVEFFNKD